MRPPPAAMTASSSEKKAAAKRRSGPPRPRGRKSQLALLGGCSPGNAFAPHILLINRGEDITSKIMLLSELHSKSICILSANGPLSAITLRLSSHSGGLDNAVYQACLEVALEGR
uniref:AT-hook motif nuclear-localized protein n=1 Tax=Triticum urartu TaxID=4572 RepID=A0A8R7TLE4_TRIUA